MEINEYIEKLAYELGFAQVGITKPASDELSHKRLLEFIENDYHGDMSWLAREPEKRVNPNFIWGEVRSIIVLNYNYAQEDDYFQRLKDRDKGLIASYARGGDYHKLIKKKLKSMARQLSEYIGSEDYGEATNGGNIKPDFRVFVDTAPVMEKVLAENAGLGWIGKHTNLVSKEYGSFTFLGVIFCNFDIKEDQGMGFHCGSCQACIDICPTNAIKGPGHLKADQCISYLTIEHKGHINAEYMEDMGNRIFGCDDCLAVCPFNKFSILSNEARFDEREGIKNKDVAYYLEFDENKFREVFAGSAMKRTGYERFMRNVIIAAGNSGNNKYIKILALKQKSDNELVAKAANWAISKLKNM